ncbi:unnamed protein product [Vitrella brassicaformis CCMP3155]|uniref:Ion transport domain-containing protein n=2 Tax=Vitrella brassicaformis TaxID=1169539 RepID=A0A0G4F6P1_VITBC|nr:unnamed protein product [Vitrella brassicaformis CCMP3155]|mmetsp:Transcript_8380/g.20480  ORF Transcript_8380/g.20480 Transcript_8380/m.20480 type:complete len:303 (+) Transcript_8380:67-975(+)|eukprot:CEM08096.1 unnamed protein product [Vitrella brassicaformis CCMP3155]
MWQLAPLCILLWLCPSITALGSSKEHEQLSASDPVARPLHQRVDLQHHLSRPRTIGDDDGHSFLLQFHAAQRPHFKLAPAMEQMIEREDEAEDRGGIITTAKAHNPFNDGRNHRRPHSWHQHPNHNYHPPAASNHTHPASSSVSLQRRPGHHHHHKGNHGVVLAPKHGENSSQGTERQKPASSAAPGGTTSIPVEGEDRLTLSRIAYETLQLFLSPNGEPKYILGLPRLAWVIVLDFVAMIAFLMCIPCVLSVAKNGCGWCLRAATQVHPGLRRCPSRRLPMATHSRTGPMVPRQPTTDTNR